MPSRPEGCECCPWPDLHGSGVINVSQNNLVKLFPNTFAVEVRPPYLIIRVHELNWAQLEDSQEDHNDESFDPTSVSDIDDS